MQVLEVIYYIFVFKKFPFLCWYNRKLKKEGNKAGRELRVNISVSKDERLDKFIRLINVLSNEIYRLWDQEVKCFV